jgi:SAM-dependent methyltransferase
MGIASSQGLPHLLFLKSKYPRECSGSILQLGRQDAYFDFGVLQTMADKFGVGLEPVKVNHVENPWVKQRVIDDVTLFSALGFQTVDSLDFVGNETPSIVHDLNQPVPAEFCGRWSVIYDGGTLEHVFDIAAAFRNIHRMLKPGGIAIHENPTNHFVDHGMWQVNPTAVVDFYSANGYEILEAWICLFEFHQNMHSEQPHRFVYEPYVFEKLSFGGFPPGLACSFVVAKKPLVHREAVTPTQGFYVRHWGESPDGARKAASQPGGLLNLRSIPRPT